MYEPVAFSFALRYQLHPGSAKKKDMFKDNLAEEQLVKLGLNARQVKAVQFVKETGRITNKEYQEINETTPKTAFRDLDNLLKNNVFIQKCEKKSTYYELLNVR